MDQLEPGTIHHTGTMGFHRAELIAVSPISRDQLHYYIATIRQSIYQGVQVPVKVTHIDPETGEEREEHIPGCTTCSI